MDLTINISFEVFGWSVCNNEDAYLQDDTQLQILFLNVLTVNLIGT